MSGADKKMDAFLKGKLAQVEHPFDVAHWQAAESLLKTAAPPKARKSNWLWALLLLIPISIWLLGMVYQRGHPPLALNCPETVVTNNLALANIIPEDDQAAFASLPSQPSPAGKADVPRRQMPLLPSGSITPPAITGQKASSQEEQQTRNLFPGKASHQELLSWEFERITQNQTALKGDLSMEEGPISYRMGRRHSRFGLGLFAGMGYAAGVDMEGSGAANPGLGATLGAYLSFQIHHRVQLSLGTGLLHRNGFKASREFLQEEFDFGFNRTRTTITPVSALYLNVPLQVQIGIAPRHRLLAGVEFWQLLNVRSRVSSTQSSSLANNQETQEILWGYRQGFNAVNWNLMAGYQFVLAPRLQLGLNLRYGLSDLTDDQYFERTALDRNVQIMLNLQYDLFRF